MVHTRGAAPWGDAPEPVERALTGAEVEVDPEVGDELQHQLIFRTEILFLISSLATIGAYS